LARLRSLSEKKLFAADFELFDRERHPKRYLDVEELLGRGIDVYLTPDDLIQRLKEGKVYVPKQAERALEHFFSPANLTALRELALRRTAERVAVAASPAEPGGLPW
jgi:K+-sensing histidine kinase KdpD